MTIARCYGLAMKIALKDRREWPLLIEEISTECQYDDCTTKNCQQVCKEWLRMQWRIQIYKENHPKR